MKRPRPTLILSAGIILLTIVYIIVNQRNLAPAGPGRLYTVAQVRARLIRLLDERGPQGLAYSTIYEANAAAGRRTAALARAPRPRIYGATALLARSGERITYAVYCQSPDCVDDTTRLLVLEKNGRAWRESWRSEPVPESGPRERAVLARDLDGDGAKEAVLYAGYGPYSLFTLRVYDLGAAPRLVFETTGTNREYDPAGLVRDFDGDGRQEILTWRVLYPAPSVLLYLVRWPQYHAWDGRAFTIVNGDFPGVFARVGRELEAETKKAEESDHPSLRNYERPAWIDAYRGLALCYAGRRAEGEALLARARQAGIDTARLEDAAYMAALE